MHFGSGLSETSEPRPSSALASATTSWLSSRRAASDHDPEAQGRARRNGVAGVGGMVVSVGGGARVGSALRGE